MPLSSFAIGLSPCTFTCTTSSVITIHHRGVRLLQLVYIGIVPPPSTVAVRVQLGAVHSKGFGHMCNDKYRALYYHTQFHCSTNPLYSTSSFFSVLPLVLATTELFYRIHSLSFFPECHIAGIIPYIAFQTDLKLVIRISVSSHYLIAHFFVLNNVPLYDDVPQFIFPFTYKGHLGCTQVLRVLNKGAINICMKVLVWA